MTFVDKISNFLNKRRGIIPALFALMCVCLIASLAGVEIKGLANLTSAQAFNTGGEIAAIFAGVMITVSILPSYKRQSGYVRVFVTLVANLCFLMTFDLAEALVDKNPDLIFFNNLFPTLVWITENVVFFFFWLYATRVLKSSGKVINILNILALGFLAVFVLIPIVTVGNTLYFKVDPVTGEYSRVQPQWWISRIPSAYFIVATIIAIFLSKESLRKKIVISIFMGLPILAMGSGGYKAGVAIQYIAMMMSVILIFAFVFSDNEKNLFSTNKELSLATNIQQTMLPNIFPAFPEREEFDIYASMEPAKEVGGDFYDFFLIDDDHLGIVVADVSDKGVPAALFMMASKIMIQNYAMLNIPPSEVLERTNRQICSNNQSEMFVTVWLGVLNLKTGLLTAANAGHEKPIIKSPNGHFELYKDIHGFVVGWNKDTKFKNYEIQLEKGSKLFLYTDGVPEATGVEGKFGRERTVETLKKYEEESPKGILTSMSKELVDFTGNLDQFDDITMLCVEYRGAESKPRELTLEFDADVKNIESMMDPILETLKEKEVDSKLAYKVRLALDEILTNICSYAYAPNTGKVWIDAKISSKKIAIAISDEGKEFNPLDSKDPDLDVPLQERSIGGLGIFISKNIMDEISYKRDNNKNILTMKKSF